MAKSQGEARREREVEREGRKTVTTREDGGTNLAEEPGKERKSALREKSERGGKKRRRLSRGSELLSCKE